MVRSRKDASWARLVVLGLAVVSVVLSGMSLSASGATGSHRAPSGTIPLASAGPSAGAASPAPIVRVAQPGEAPVHGVVPKPRGPDLPARLPSPPGGTENGAVATGQALASLARGEGPAGGHPLPCTETSSLNAFCGGSHRPSGPASGSEYGFQFGNTSGTAPAFYGASLSWDEIDDTVVFFGGLNTTNDEPQDATWLYGFGQWVNWTDYGGPAPPARYLASMAYDAYDGEVVLTGGCGVTICPIPDTWTFQHLAWVNDTPDGGYPGLTAGASLYGASMTGWADTDNGTILFGGCEDRACDVESNVTYSFQDLDGCPGSPAPCWAYYYLITFAPSPRAEAALSVFQDSGTVLLYGGYSYAGMSLLEYRFTTLNDTWTFDGGPGTWADQTEPSQVYATHEYPDTPRADANLFWDPYYDTMFMYGGSASVPSTRGGVPAVSTTSVEELWYYNETGLDWENLSGDYSLPSSARVLPAFADSVDGTPPVLVGGESAALAELDDAWVWEGPLQGTLAPAPTTSETNATVEFTASFVQEVATSDSSQQFSGNISFGDGTFADVTSGPHVYTSAGTYSVVQRASDYFGVTNLSTTSVSVHLFSVVVAASPDEVDVGAWVNFTAAASQGTPGYGFNWTMTSPDSGPRVPGHYGVRTPEVAYGNISATFGEPGVVYANVSVHDRTGTVVNASVAAMINPPLAVHPTASYPSVDQGASEVFGPGVSGGTAPDTYHWLFGDGGSSTSASPAHVYGAVGTYVVHLWVNDSSIGRVASAITVGVNPPLNASASASTTSPTPGQSVGFSSSANGGTPPYTYSWSFGDGESATGSAPSHAYGSTGTYTLNVWINDSGGGTYHTTLTLSVASAGAGLSSTFGGIPLWAWITLVAVLVVAAVGALIVMRRRSKRTPPPPDPPPPPPWQETSSPAPAWDETPAPPAAGDPPPPGAS